MYSDTCFVGNFKTFCNFPTFFLFLILLGCKELNGQTMKKSKSYHDFVDKSSENVTLTKSFQTLNKKHLCHKTKHK